MSRLSCLYRRWVFLAALNLGLACAQSANTADLVGFIRDSSGAMPRVEISVTNQDTRLARKTVTQDNGFYRIRRCGTGGCRAHDRSGGDG
jgi:hypothetical protein